MDIKQATKNMEHFTTFLHHNNLGHGRVLDYLWGQFGELVKGITPTEEQEKIISNFNLQMDNLTWAINHNYPTEITFNSLLEDGETFGEYIGESISNGGHGMDQMDNLDGREQEYQFI